MERYALESLLDRTVDFMCVVDLNQKVLIVNGVGRMLSEMPDGDIPKDLLFFELFAEGDTRKLKERFLPALIDGNSDVDPYIQLKADC